MNALSLILLIFVVGGRAVAAAEFPKIYNSEDPSQVPIAPEEAIRKWQLPDGFDVTLFAGDPDVRQPIGMTFDARGRLWVAENYTYAERGVQFDRALRDRILIFEDTDQDGRFDHRKVFWDQAQLLTSIEIGFGGIWALCSPHLIFIPDRDGDDVPDGEPEVLLDGWNAGGIQHNVVNGLKWGPDGWLYGRHGILASSHVGKPGAAPDERQEINCGVWRFHPTRRTFEIVAYGTTNPWGMDWDEHGEPFFINTVIGHLWHLIPGAHYRRMYGEDLDPRAYELIDQHADHYHWDTREIWSDVRKLGVTQTSSDAGGGHAHSGLMIYNGDNWPEKYRGRAFTVNFHGRRLNQDRLERSGSGYIGRHEPDEFLSEDLWFRGVELIYGPDGGVYVADWSDTGECHEQDGVHRTSGRIFKITYGKPRPMEALKSVGDLTDADLLRWLTHSNEWYSRQARQILQQRAAGGAKLQQMADRLRTSFDEQDSATGKLRVLWAIHAIGAADQQWLRQLLNHGNEHIRVWAIRLLTDELPLRVSSNRLDDSLRAEFARLARNDASALVRLTLASTLQRLPVGQRTALAAALVGRAEDASDHNLPLMLWYGIKGIAQEDPMSAVTLAEGCKIPVTRRLIARRIGEDLERSPGAVNGLLRAAVRSGSEAFQMDLLDGLAEAWRGWRAAPKPESWDLTAAALGNSTSEALQRRVRDLSALFGDGRALDEIRQVALDENAAIANRRAALQTLIEHRAPELRSICEGLLAVRDLAGTAARGLALFDDPAVGRLLAERYHSFYPQQRPAVIETLISRPEFARELLRHVGTRENQIPPRHITAFHARQIRAFTDPELTRKLVEVWGDVRNSDADRRETIARYKALLTPTRLAEADRSRGRELFNQTCASCHKLYGIGGEIGPDLTGSGRHNLDYLLENVVDPSAVLAADYRASLVSMNDGRLLTGVVIRQTERAITIQTATENLVVSRDDVESIQQSSLSLMPDGLLETLRDEQVRDLIAYLMFEAQVQLPKQAE